MRLGSVIGLALITSGCTTPSGSAEEIARLCGIPDGWHQLETAPENSADLLLLPVKGTSERAGKSFSAKAQTHKRWFTRDQTSWALCRFQVLRGTCDWPNETIVFEVVNGQWAAARQMATICVSANP